jgi:hypothetical protein
VLLRCFAGLDLETNSYEERLLLSSELVLWLGPSSLFHTETRKLVLLNTDCYCVLKGKQDTKTVILMELH